MSVDIEVLSTIRQPLRWADIEPRLRRNLGEDAERQLGSEAGLRRLGSGDRVAPDEPLAVWSYTVDLTFPSTLGLTVVELDKYVAPLEYLSDYGRNLNPEQVADLARRWAEGGLYYSLVSHAGRHRDETGVLVALAAAVAEACQGAVIVMNHDIFDLGVGVYAPEVFAAATPRF